MKFDLILTDPPWAYSKRVGQGVARDQYPTLTDRELKALPVQDLAADDCMYLMWATGPRLDSAIEILKHHGFRFVTVFMVWVKTYQDGTPLMGLGHYTRSACEFLLLGVRGKVASWRDSRSVSQLLEIPRKRHSKKPAKELRQRLCEYFGNERYERLRKVELFAREAPDEPGWSTHGNEMDNADVHF